MTYAIVFDSRTGNTERLAHAVADTLPKDDCLAFGRVGEVDAATIQTADTVYVGFWTNRGDCTDEMSELLTSLEDKKIFLFGTAGFGADETYFAGVAGRVAVHVPASAQVVGVFMCQGKMPISVRTRYERMAQAQPAQAARMNELIENFDEAMQHPNEDDLVRLRAAVEAV